MRLFILSYPFVNSIAFRLAGLLDCRYGTRVPLNVTHLIRWGATGGGNGKRITTLNHAEAIRRCSDKLRTFRILSEELYLQYAGGQPNCG